MNIVTICELFRRKKIEKNSEKKTIELIIKFDLGESNRRRTDVAASIYILAMCCTPACYRFDQILGASQG